MKPTKAVKAKALKEIAEIDESLSLMKDNYANVSEENKGKAMRLIDRLLDERLAAMAVRDGKTLENAK